MERIRQRYCRNNGHPSKDLRAVTGCLILRHLFHLTDNETCQNHLYDNLWIEALDLGGKPLEDRCICPRTLWEHSRRLGDGGNGDNLPEEIFNSVNLSLAKAAHIDLRTQRLDSVHIRNNMARLSRIQLFRRTTRLFPRDLGKRRPGLPSGIPRETPGRHLSSDGDNENP
ncbi:MAG: transposase, partial [Deltaproteobacteria bacterium]|nr:transposase [Deltaproteobacteria bacterium]